MRSCWTRTAANESLQLIPAIVAMTPSTAKILDSIWSTRSKVSKVLDIAEVLTNEDADWFKLVDV